MFINCSNHKSDLWGEDQKRAAERYGDIVDFPFPNVVVSAEVGDIANLAAQTVQNILQKQPDVVMCQGEYTLTYAIVKALREKQIPVVAACTERKVIEKQLEDGSVQKVSRFQFAGFRQYV